MKSAAIKPVTGLILVYFMFSSLVFMGQDLTVRKTYDNSWCISLANHSHNMWGHSPPEDRSFAYHHHPCKHQHKSGEVHICVERHKVLASGNMLELPGNDLQAARLLIPDTVRPLAGTSHGHNSVFLHGLDPGPPLSETASSSILLL